MFKRPKHNKFKFLHGGGGGGGGERREGSMQENLIANKPMPVPWELFDSSYATAKNAASLISRY